jgi:hypothetical protein
LLAGVEDDAPVLVVVHFVFREASAGRITPLMKVYGGPQQEVTGIGVHAVATLGSQKEISRRVGRSPDWWRLNTAAGIRELIEAEADHNPQFVGAPVDLVSIDRDGAGWIERKAQCPAIGPPLSR